MEKARRFMSKESLGDICDLLGLDSNEYRTVPVVAVGLTTAPLISLEMEFFNERGHLSNVVGFVNVTVTSTWGNLPAYSGDAVLLRNYS